MVGSLAASGGQAAGGEKVVRRTGWLFSPRLLRASSAGRHHQANDRRRRPAMASPRIAAAAAVASPLSRHAPAVRCVCSAMAIRPSARPSARPPSARPTTIRPMATSATVLATEAKAPSAVTPLSAQEVLATIHHFPSLEPLRFQAYPATHLGLPFRRDILHRAVVYEGDKTRLGTASTKTRYEVHGSRHKVRPQKGTGRARLGDRQSPMLRGGGVAFGPRPRDFATLLPKRLYDIAWRTALSYRYRRGHLIIVDNALELESPSPRLLRDVFAYHTKLCNLGKSLFVTLEPRPLLEQAMALADRPNQACQWTDVDVKQLLELDSIIIERPALHNILFSHQEDLTGHAVRPWQIVRTLPPRELEATLGWKAFRDLALSDPAAQNAARADAYETAAVARYAHAESLASGPQRDHITVSSYRLLAEAKELHFAQLTGMSFADYTRLQVDDSTLEREAKYPRIQALDYRIALETSPSAISDDPVSLQKEQVTLNVRQLELERYTLIHDAALLAAQIHEHLAEAHDRAGYESAAREALARASDERTTLDIIDLRLLEARLALAQQKLVVARLTGMGHVQATRDVEACTKALEAKRAETEALQSPVEAEPEEEEEKSKALAEA